MKKATNAMRLALALKRNGVKYLFGQSNPPTITLACDDIGIKQIGYRQENAGSYMAHGYAVESNTVPVVTAQNGPAATLLVPGLAESSKSSKPVVAIVEEVARNHEEKNAFQELDHIELFKGVSKWVKKISVQDHIEDMVNRAFIIAASGRPGPVVLLCPKDIFNDATEYSYEDEQKQSYGTFPLDRSVANPKKVKEAADIITKAKSPLIYAGGGVISSHAQEILRNIQEECSIPVATTTMGKGSVDETHPLTLGPIGYYMGERSPTKYMKNRVKESDVIILVGNRTNQNGTDGWELLPSEATYIHIDVDPVEIGRNYESIRLAGDAKLTLQSLFEYLKEKGLDEHKKNRESLEKEIEESKNKHKQVMEEMYAVEDGKIKVEKFLNEVNKRLTENHIIVSDASIASVWNASYIQAINNRKFIFPRGLAGLGWGLPMAMGAKIASPDKKVFCLTGDGGFAHVWSELETCRREGIDIVIVVINNSILGYQKYAETSMYGRYTNVCDFTFVDHTKIAEACGIKNIRIEDVKEINDALDSAFNHNGSVLIDLITDPNNVPPVTAMDSILEEEFSHL